MSWLPAPRAVRHGHEINPEFQIGCMIAMCPVYPATCRPEDILMAEKAMQKRYYYTDVHIHGVYPANIPTYWKRKGFEFDVTEKDLEMLTKGTCRLILDSVTICHFVSNIRKTIRILITVKAMILSAIPM